MNKICCIYAIKDKRSDKVIYIGQTKDFKQRKYQYFGSTSRPIYKYLYDEGRDNFEMIIIEELSNEILREEMLLREQEYIEKYNTIEDGQNINKSGHIFIDNKREYYKQYKKEYMKDYMRRYRLNKKQ